MLIWTHTLQTFLQGGKLKAIVYYFSDSSGNFALMGIAANIQKIKEEIGQNVKLVAVSKTKPAEAVLEAYQAGQRCFGENKVQELCAKQAVLPNDIEWHLIGHLQTNKVKYMASFVSMIESVDSEKLLAVISKEAQKHRRSIDCLLQVHIAHEETKFGFSEQELNDFLSQFNPENYPGIQIRGLMGMATFTENQDQIRNEFNGLATIYRQCKTRFFPNNMAFDCLSMGMSGDYAIAVACGSNVVRVGSLIFGNR